MIYLLDTSALLAHYRGELGAQRVQELFDGDGISILIASISITEFSRRMVDLGAFEHEIDVVTMAYGRLFSEVVTIDRHIAKAAFLLGQRASSRLPLADSLIAASAASRKATLVHRDPHFQSIDKNLLLQEKL
jgi:predicted nucleic acid-binding protein